MKCFSGSGIVGVYLAGVVGFLPFYGHFFKLSSHPPHTPQCPPHQAGIAALMEFCTNSKW